MAMVSRGRSTLNPDAPLFVPAAVRQVEDFSPEWWQLVTTSTWFHDYWLSQQQGENGFFGNTADATGDIADMLPDSIDTDDDLLSMEAQYEQFLLASEMETMNTFSSPFAYNQQQMPTNGSEAEAEMLIRSLSLSKSTPRSQMETAKYPGNPVQLLSPIVGPHSTQQPR